MPWSAGRAVDRLRRAADLLAIAISLMALGLRIYRLDARSLWTDEILTATTSQIRGVEDLARWFHDSFVVRPDQTPLFFLISSIVAPLGSPEIVLRLPSAVFGTLVVPVVFLLGKRLFSPVVGLVAACLIAILPVAVWYSQEARPYALFTLLVCLQMLLVWEATRLWRLPIWLGLLCTSVLAVYTHWFGVLTIAAVAAYAGLVALSEVWAARGDTAGSRLAVLHVAIVVNFTLLSVASALIWYIAVQEGMAHQQASDLGLYPNVAPSLQSVARRLSIFGLWWLPLLVSVIGMAAGILAGRGRLTPPFLLLITWLAVPLALLAIELHWRLVYLWDRYLLFLVPAAALLVGAGCLALGQLATRMLAGAGYRQNAQATVSTSTVAACLCASMAAVMTPHLFTTGSYTFQTPKDDYRTVTQYVIQAAPPGSLILAMGPPLGAGQTSWLVYGGLHYYEGREGADVPITFGVDRKVAGYLRRSHGRVWAVAYDGIPCRCDQRRAAVTVRRFPGMLVARDADGWASPAAQAQTLLAWGAGFQPSLRHDLAVLASTSGPGP